MLKLLIFKNNNVDIKINNSENYALIKSIDKE